MSHAEVHWNANSGNFEVALCVWPADLEKALKGDTGKSVDLDKVEDLDQLLETYISKKFRITRAESQDESKSVKNVAKSLRWVGHASW